MDPLDNRIEKTRKILNDGKIDIGRGSRLHINESPYQVILENQLVILETLKSLIK